MQWIIAFPLFIKWQVEAAKWHRAVLWQWFHICLTNTRGVAEEKVVWPVVRQAGRIQYTSTDSHKTTIILHDGKSHERSELDYFI